MHLICYMVFDTRLQLLWTLGWVFLQLKLAQDSSIWTGLIIHQKGKERNCRCCSRLFVLWCQQTKSKSVHARISLLSFKELLNIVPSLDAVHVLSKSEIMQSHNVASGMINKLGMSTPNHFCFFLEFKNFRLWRVIDPPER